ncbi:MAG: nitroreductase family deazaflavin-dependent oxidoreductase [Actinomycetota bacterium]|nr:nitroreductase family deazaflavin-dependent oxidoreductase [Actinomycetota bacterium]
MTTPQWRSPPTGPRRWFLRLPLLVFRARLGWMFGGRLVMLVHRGRRTGLEHRVVVEVASRDPASGTVTVASGYGPAADWYRNLLAHPEATMVLGARRVAVRARPMPAEEGGELMVDYARRHPRAARMVARQMGVRVDGSDRGYRELGRALPYQRLEQTAPQE